MFKWHKQCKGFQQASVRVSSYYSSSWGLLSIHGTTSLDDYLSLGGCH